MNPGGYPNAMGGHGMPPQNQVQQMRLTLLTRYQTLQQQRQQMAPMSWQAQVTPLERATGVINLISALSLAQGHGMPMQPQIMQKASEIENDKFQKSPDKNTYVAEIRKTMYTLNQIRQQQAQQSMNANAQVVNMQAGIPGAPSMQSTPSNQGNQFQPPFPPQLQHQMQASAIPGSSQPRMDMNTPNMGNTQNPQQPQQPLNQQSAFMNQAKQPGYTPEEARMVESFIRQHIQRVPKEQHDALNAKMAELPPQDQQKIRDAGGPLLYQLKEKAKGLVMHRRAQLANAGQGAMGANGVPQPMNNQQMQGQGLGGTNFDLTQIVGQQADAMRSAESGQLVVPASNNRQPVGGLPIGMNPNGLMGVQGMPGGNQMPNTIRQQPYLNPQQAQAHAQNMQARIQAAQARANASQANVQNPMGGLNQPGQQSSMPLLTTPVSRQAGSATPQQRPPSGMMQMTPPSGQVDPRALQALQQAQNRVTSLGAQAHQFSQTQRRQLPPELADRLTGPIKQTMMTLPEDHYHAMLNHYKQTGNLNIPQPPGSQPGQMPGPPGQGLGQNVAMALNQPQNQGMPGQPQIPQSMINQNQLQQRIQQQRLLQQSMQQGMPNPQIIAELDKMPFPPSFISANFKIQVPENIKLWGQLKEWITQHPQLAGSLTIKHLIAAQIRLAPASRVVQQQGNQAAQGNMANGIRAGPGGPVATPQMGGTAPGPQQQARIPQHLLQVTNEDIMKFRRANPNLPAHATDDQLRGIILKQKANQIARVQQQRMLIQQQHQPQPGQQFPMGAQPGQTMPHLQQQRPPQVQPPQQRPPSQQPQARPGAPPKPGVPPQMQQGQRASQPPSGLATPQQPVQKGVKRPAQDDLMEVVQQSQTSQAPQAPQAPEAPMASRPGQMAGQAGQPPPGLVKLQQLKKQVDTLKVGPPQPLKPDERHQISQCLVEAAKFLPRLGIALQIYAEHGMSEERYESNLRQILVAQKTIWSSVDTKNWALLDLVTVDGPRLRQFLSIIRTFVVGTFTRYHVQVQRLAGQAATQQSGGQKGAVPQPPQPPQPPAQPSGSVAAGAPAQLSAANLEQQQAALRSAQGPRRPNFKPPAAPTAGPGQFQHPFGASPQGPQGVPLYDGKPGLKPDQLKIPPEKRRKKDGQPPSAASTPAHATPGGSAASPTLGKAASPDLKRSQPPEPAKIEPPKPTFKCPDQGCDKAFESREQLDNHRKEAHPPIEDYLQFALDAVDNALGFNPDGTRKPGFGPKAAAQEKNGTKPAISTGKDPQTPNVKREAATPMARTTTQPGKAGATDGKAATTSGAPDGKDKDKGDDVVKSIEDDPWAGCSVTSAELSELFKPYDTLSGADWLPKPPVLTPATTPSPATSKDTAETQDTELTDHANDDTIQYIMPKRGFEVFNDPEFSAWHMDDSMLRLLSNPAGVGLDDQGLEVLPSTENLNGVGIDREKEPFDWMDWEGIFGPGSVAGEGNKVPGWENTNTQDLVF